MSRDLVLYLVIYNLYTDEKLKITRTQKNKTKSIKLETPSPITLKAVDVGQET